MAEDRPDFEPAVKLLLMSLAKRCPAVPIYLIFLPANRNFIGWLANYSCVTLTTAVLEGTSSFNVKPHAILHLLRQGHDEVVWIDSDVIVTRNLSKVLEGVRASTIVVTE